MAPPSQSVLLWTLIAEQFHALDFGMILVSVTLTCAFVDAAFHIGATNN